MSQNKTDKVTSYHPIDYSRWRIPSESQETKEIRKISNEIKQIKNETEAIQSGEISKPLASEYATWLKRLNVI